MENVHIYLSGGMSGLSFEEQNKWRKQFSDAIKYGDYDYSKKPYIFNPVDYYNFEEAQYRSEREVMEFELAWLRKADLVVVNFNNPKSIGTAMELMIAKEYHIPVIALNKDGNKLHPWLVECSTRICDSMRELVEHVANFYLK